MNFVTHPWHISLGLYRKTSMISVRMIICEAQWCRVEKPSLTSEAFIDRVTIDLRQEISIA